MRVNDPCSIGNTEIKNRIVMAPMISNIADPSGITNENHAHYLMERAIGGVGLIISEYTYVNDRNSRGSPNQMGMFDRAFIPKFRRLTERIHDNGSKIFTQLVHAGGKALYKSNKRPSVAPSSVDYLGHVPDELTTAEIGDIIEDFVKAARMAEDSRFDGIEVHGAHGYLVQEFISPALNRRNDSYGGSFEKRLRFPREILEALRTEIDIPVGIRLSLYEDDIDGYDANYGLKIAESLEYDYVHFSAGRFAPPGSSASFYSIPAHIASRLPRKPRVKTMVVGSVRNASDVQEVLKVADFVAVGRALLADPHFADKVIHGSEIIRPCIRCNQACRDLALGEVRCTVNPDTGFEFQRNNYIGISGEIAIVGGGIKGMEAALSASKHGLSVVLYEMNDEIGGQLLQIQDEMKKKEFSALLEYYKNALEKSKVDIRTGEKYTGAGIYCLPDRVYMNLPKKSDLKVDSNIYQHHDEILGLATESKISVSRRSLDSLDRVRRIPYTEALQKLGVEIVSDNTVSYDFSLYEKSQYDIRSAMVSGRKVIRDYISENRNLYL